MEHKRLDEILSPEQRKQVRRIVSGRRSLEARTDQLKKYLANFRAELEKKGVHPEYLAYAIVFGTSEQQRLGRATKKGKT